MTDPDPEYRPADFTDPPELPLVVQPPEVTSDERTWGMLAELSGLLGSVVPLANFVAPLVIYLVYKDKSKFVSFHAMQALFLQLALLAVVFAGIVLSVVTCGIGLIVAVPLFFAAAIGSLVLMIIAAIKANAGEWYEMWLIGSWTRKALKI